LAQVWKICPVEQKSKLSAVVVTSVIVIYVDSVV